MSSHRVEQIGPCELHLADCREVLSTLTSVDACVSDPPYGIGYDASESTQQGIQKFEVIAGDYETFDPTPFMGFSDVLLWGCNNYCHAIPPHQGQWYFWDKVCQNGLKVRIGEGEFAWHKRGTKPRSFRHLWSGAYRHSESGQKSQHPTQKPVALMRWCLSLVEGETIFDPYMGSGTTGVACIKSDRRFIGCEVNEAYFEIACNRIRRAWQEKCSELKFEEPANAQS